MEAYRLKNIVILILVFLNLFLLGMLGRHLWQKHFAQHRLEEELRLLYSENGLSLAESIDLSLPTPTSLSLTRDLDGEAAVAAFILGEAVPAEDQGGGIYSYTGAYGTVHFRSNGAFDYTAARPVESPMEFSHAFCDAFGYRLIQESPSATDGSADAIQLAGESPIYNATVSFLFDGNSLLSLSGSYVSAHSASSSHQNTITLTTALVRLLNYLDQSGTVSSQVTSIRPVYELQPTSASSPRLAAKWEIVTDTGHYYVNCSSGEIQRT